MDTLTIADAQNNLSYCDRGDVLIVKAGDPNYPITFLDAIKRSEGINSDGTPFVIMEGTYLDDSAGVRNIRRFE